MTTKKKPLVVLVESIHPIYHRALEKACRVRTPKGFSEDELIEACMDAEGMVIRTKGGVTGRLLRECRRLKVVGRHGIGVDHIDLQAAQAEGVWVVNTPAGSTVAVAEHTWMMILALAKNALPGDRSVRKGDYEMRSRTSSLQLEGKTLGILGLGRIGGWVAQIGHLGFGMRILYTDILKYPEKEMLLKARKVNLSNLLESSDILSIHVPLTEKTAGMIGAPQMIKMKPGAILINCARGAVLDSQAAGTLLAQDRLGSVGLDVFDPEIPPPDHPMLSQTGRSILSPHSAAQTPEARFNYSAVVDDVLRVFRGKRPLWPVVEPKNPRQLPEKE